MVTACRACVEPRARSPESGEALPLIDALEPHLGGAGVVSISGPPGAGKTTALAHLATMDLAIELFDEPPSALLEGHCEEALVVYTCEEPESAIDHRAVLRLEPWGRDDWIEYLLAKYPDRCASVVNRLGRDDPVGRPAFWRPLLDLLATDPSLPDLRSAMRRRFASRAEDFKTYGHACFKAVLWQQGARHERFSPLTAVAEGRFVERVLAADHVAASIDAGVLANPLPRELVLEVARLAGLASKLRPLADGAKPSEQPMAASIVLAMDPAWRPEPGSEPRLAHAHLDRVSWQGLDLSGAVLLDASLRRANLAHSRLDKATLAHADLSKADLRGCSASRVTLSNARLARADLRGADLTHAYLEGADLAGADFRGTRLDEARLAQADMEQSRWLGASFREARLQAARMEFLDLTGSVFTGARLDGASLTGAELGGACLRSATLSHCALAEINLEGADLRGANLEGATFHLGSSRSGRVPSDVPMEGSMTGYYTDDLAERGFLPPERIRKANLSRADLRGARLEHVDFYLVDLRGARYDADQRAILVRTGAIL